MHLVDANIVLRYLLDDHPELSPAATEILEQHATTLSVEVACEVVYVLQKVYAIDRAEICQQLSLLVDEEWVSMEKSAVFLQALKYYSDSKIDFVDTLLWAYHTVEGAEVSTFDKKLNKHMQRA